MWYCPICESKQRSSRDKVFVDAGDIIIFQLKRYRTVQNQIVKDNQRVKLVPQPLTLLIRPESDVSFKREYSLVATINHSGNLNSGHYWSYILDPITKNWLYCNDRMVQPVANKVLDNNTSYVLIYKSQ